MRVLLTFAGARDPFNLDEVVAGRATDGPVLTVFSEEHYDRIHIFSDERLLGNAHELLRVIGERHPGVGAALVPVNLPDPTDYEAIFYQLSRETRGLAEQYAKSNPQFFVSTASGTPQIQTVWFLLARSGLFPAALLKVTPRRFLKPSGRAVSEIRLSLSEFPKVTPGDLDSIELASLRIQNEQLEAERDGLFAQVEAEGIIGTSRELQAALTILIKAAPTDLPILLLGETGTGKELFAKAIHKRSRRSRGPFISVNCAAIPGPLIESELFGHEVGAFTGATKSKKGKFELADGGTLFLDEVADLSGKAQAKLLRALQEGEIEKVGSTTTRRVDVRIIAATNRDLRRAVEAGSFREDLFYRLHVIPIHLPPLRKRREDIPLLIEQFLSDSSRRSNAKTKQLSKRALALMLDYPWPGNIRELRHVIERIALLSEDNTISTDDLPAELRTPTMGGRTGQLSVTIPPQGMDLKTHLHRLERAYFQTALDMKNGNGTAAARLLGLKPHTFRKRATTHFGR